MPPPCVAAGLGRRILNRQQRICSRPFLLAYRHASSQPSTEDLLKKVYAARQESANSTPQSSTTAQPEGPSVDASARKGGFGPFPQPESPSGSSSKPPPRGKPFPQRPMPQFKEPTSVRVQKLGSNLVSFTIVGAGLLLTLSIVYSFSTEVLASGSGTNVLNRCTPLIEANDELHSILRTPLSFHGQPPQFRTRRNRHISSSLVDRPDGKQDMLVKFWVDGTPKSDPSEGVWEKVKRTVFRPLIVEPINQPAANFQPSQAERQAELKAEKKKQDAWTKNKQTWGEWFGSGFSAIWPVGGLSAGRGGSGPLRSSSSSYPVKPAFGSYESGEATALLVRAADGSFQLKQLVVDFREQGKHSWRVTVFSKTDQQVLEDYEASSRNGMERKDVLTKSSKRMQDAFPLYFLDNRYAHF